MDMFDARLWSPKKSTGFSASSALQKKRKAPREVPNGQKRPMDNKNNRKTSFR
jgi:hypothetical protein